MWLSSLELTDFLKLANIFFRTLKENYTHYNADIANCSSDYKSQVIELV